MHKLSSSELYLLAALAFVLPLLEVPKTLLWLAFVTVWLVRSINGEGWGGKLRYWDAIFGALIGAAFFTAWAATPLPQQWLEAADTLRWVLLGWLLSRSEFSSKQVSLMLNSILIGTLIAGIHGLWIWWIDPARSDLQLHSVGHVNHSAVYLSLAALAAIGSLLTQWPLRRPGGTMSRLLMFLPAGTLVLLVLVSDSRGALIALLLGVFFLGVGSRHHSAIHPLKLMMILLMSLVVAVISRPSIVQKTIFLTQNGYIQSKRPELARVAIETWRQHPFFGVGPANFGRVTETDVKTWVELRGDQFSASNYVFMNHAHSLYFNTLAERGTLGIGALLFLLIAWVQSLSRRPGRGQTKEWVRWSMAVAAGTVVVVAGIFNTTLHHEHGLLAMLLLGPWIGPRDVAYETKAPQALPSALMHGI